MPVFFLAMLATACTTIPPEVSDYGSLKNAIELTETPFFPQEAYQCGPAALMTVLTTSGAQTTLQKLVNQVYLPARRGSLQSEMLAATRAAERLPYVLDPSLGAITAELAMGRPVLILQNLGISWIPFWHYAVVVGVDPIKNEIVLRSGTDARRILRTRAFLRTWRRSNYWAIVTLQPGELPANPDRLRYADAVAGLEQTGHIAAAKAAWQAGVALWPMDRIHLFGLANSLYALDDLNSAEDYFRHILDLDASSPGARNNLAMTLLAQGRRSEALQEIDIALQLAGDSSVRADLLDTRRLIIETVD